MIRKLKSDMQCMLIELQKFTSVRLGIILHNIMFECVMKADEKFFWRLRKVMGDEKIGFESFQQKPM